MKQRQLTKQLNACRHKKDYATLGEALDHIQYMRRRYDVYKRAYKCPICSNYHLTHANKTIVLKMAFKQAGLEW